MQEVSRKAHFRSFQAIYSCLAWNIRFDLDNALKTILDCLQMVEAITNDSLCFEIHAEKRIDRRNPRVEFGMEEINEQKNIFSQNKSI